MHADITYGYHLVVKDSDISHILSNPKSNAIQKCVQKMSKMFWRLFVNTHYIYKLLPVCQMFSDCH